MIDRTQYMPTAGHPPKGVAVPLYSQPNSAAIRVRLLPGQARNNSQPAKRSK